MAKVSVEKLKIKAKLNEADIELENLQSDKSTLEASVSQSKTETLKLSKLADCATELENTVSTLQAELTAVTTKLLQADQKVSAAEKLVTAVSVDKMKLKAQLAEYKSAA